MRQEPSSVDCALGCGIFLSHSSRDAEIAAALASRLTEWGFQSLFLDFNPELSIPAGHDWSTRSSARSVSGGRGRAFGKELSLPNIPYVLSPLRWWARDRYRSRMDDCPIIAVRASRRPRSTLGSSSRRKFSRSDIH